MSSTFSLGEVPVKTEEDPSVDGEAEEEFDKLVNGIKDVAVDENGEQVSGRPSRPHHSAGEKERPEHPISPANNEVASDGRVAREDALRECLFCNTRSQDLEHNLKHMQKIHSLFIPERPFLADPEGLMLYLNRKVSDHWQCLYCNRLKWSEDGIKTHMRDTEHCKIAYDTEDQQLEIGAFYDFRSTYSDDDDSYSDEDEDMLSEEVSGAAPGGGVKLSRDEDGGWETSSTVSSVPTEELGVLYADPDDADRARRADRIKTHKHHSHSDNRKHRTADGWHSHAHHTPHAVYHDEYELHMPTGRVAGHRSLNKYYRQNLHNYLTPSERVQRLLEAGERSDEDDDDGTQFTQEQRERGRARARPTDTERENRMQGLQGPGGSQQQRAIIPTRAQGGLGMISVSEAKKRQVRATEKKERKREGRAQAKQQWRADRIGNSQKHYRDPLLQ
jgi:pre-60S factor REI1